MPQVAASQIRIVPNHNDVFAISAGRRLAVVEASGLDVSGVDHDVFVMVDGVGRYRAQRDAGVHN